MVQKDRKHDSAPPAPRERDAPLFLRNRSRFLAFLRRHVESEAAAEELLQHAFLKAVRHQADWEAKEDVVAWFYRILPRRCARGWRKPAACAPNMAVSIVPAGATPAVSGRV